MHIKDELVALAREAGRGILDIYSRSGQFKVQAKEDHSPLTQADLISHDTIIKGLKQLTPDIPILSEEDSKIPFSTRTTWKKYWCVDPLDGTREFIRHSGEFVVCIALIENHQPVFGLVYAPVHKECYIAAKGQGAFKITDKEIPIHTRPWQKDKTIILSSRGMKPEKIKQHIGESLGDFELMPSGSAIKFCRIADGQADFYPRFGPTCEWDTAAGQIILTEAGGILVDLSWQPLRYNSEESLLNPQFIAVGDKKLLKILEEALT